MYKDYSSKLDALKDPTNEDPNPDFGVFFKVSLTSRTLGSGASRPNFLSGGKGGKVVHSVQFFLTLKV